MRVLCMLILRDVLDASHLIGAVACELFLVGGAVI